MKLIAAVSIFLASSTAAFAADLAPQPVEPEAPIAVPFSWAGFYVGAQAGYQWGQVSGPFQDSARTASGPYSFNTNGGMVGGYTGFNYQYDALVVGVEGDGNFAFGNKSHQNVIYPDAVGLYDIRAEEEWTADARLRVGYAFGRFLPYIAGGVAFGNVKTTYSAVGDAPYLSNSSNRVGWTIGAGLEYAITDNIIARIEYRYTDLGSKSFNNILQDTYDRVKFHSNSVLVGVSYKF
jgi:outer membrane immunogenic protein